MTHFALRIMLRKNKTIEMFYNVPCQKPHSSQFTHYDTRIYDSEYVTEYKMQIYNLVKKILVKSIPMIIFKCETTKQTKQKQKNDTDVHSAAYRVKTQFAGP